MVVPPGGGVLADRAVFGQVRPGVVLDRRRGKPSPKAPVQLLTEQGRGEHGAEGGLHAGSPAGPPSGGVSYGADQRLCSRGIE